MAYPNRFEDQTEVRVSNRPFDKNLDYAKITVLNAKNVCIWPGLEVT